MRGLLVGGFALGILLLVCGLVWGLTVDGIGSPMSQCVHALQNPTSGIAIPDGSTVSGGYSLTPLGVECSWSTPGTDQSGEHLFTHGALPTVISIAGALLVLAALLLTALRRARRR
ncbi:hypothetical protein GCM10009840_05470 [Pseudolysinimonas kribbensis]